MMDFVKNIKNKTIFWGTLLYSILIGVLYSLDKFSTLYLMANVFVVALTIGLTLAKDILFLTVVDVFIRQRIPFKQRICEIIKTICGSKLILLPLSVFLLLLNVFFKLDLILVSKIVSFFLIYVSQLVMLLFYKAVMKSEWIMAIKVVSAEVIITNLVTQIFKCI